MYRTMLKSTIHRATVTQAEVDHPGSVTLDEDLMDAADLLAGEQVAIVDVTNGARLETYVVPGRRGSGVLAVNGAAARLIERGDVVIVTSYAILDEARARTVESRVVLVDNHNRQRDLAAAPATTAEPEPAGLVAAETDDAARLDALIQAGA